MTITPAVTNMTPMPMNDLNDVPAVDINFIKTVTKELTPEDVKYVADIKNITSQCEACGCEDEEANVLFVCKIMAFSNKFRLLHWASATHAEHTIIDDFIKELNTFMDSVAENIQAICGKFCGSDGRFTTITLPESGNALEIINELKICCQNWMERTKDNREYEGCRNAVSTFLECVYKTVYLLRMTK